MNSTLNSGAGKAVWNIFDVLEKHVVCVEFLDNFHKSILLLYIRHNNMTIYVYRYIYCCFGLLYSGMRMVHIYMCHIT